MNSLPDTMKALVVEGVNQLTYKDVPVPKIKADEVLVKVKACGICGSDIPRAKSGGVHFYPIIVGHEFSGEIAAIGDEVKNAAVGQRVTVAPLVPCFDCENCYKGNPAMCQHYSFIGSRQDGAMAQYVAVPSKNIVPIADNVSFEHAACIEPITVAIHGVERAGAIDSGKSAIVYGCGTIGILTMQCLKAKGLERVYVIDIDDHKLALAKELGAYETLNSLKYIGTAHRDVTIPAKTFEQILRGELHVTGSWQSFSAPFPGHEWIAAAEYLQSGKVKVDKIITHKFPLSAGMEAFDTLIDKESRALKVMYTMD